MFYAAFGLTALVALVHVYIFWMETLAWESPRVRATFGTDADFAAKSKVLAGNQGVYNLVLALGLVAGLIHGEQILIRAFLASVIVVGLYGAATVSKRILFVQALPAALALAAWLLV